MLNVKTFNSYIINSKHNQEWIEFLEEKGITQNKETPYTFIDTKSNTEYQLEPSNNYSYIHFIMDKEENKLVAICVSNTAPATGNAVTYMHEHDVEFKHFDKAHEVLPFLEYVKIDESVKSVFPRDIFFFIEVESDSEYLHATDLDSAFACTWA